MSRNEERKLIFRVDYLVGGASPLAGRQRYMREYGDPG
jgi:hypothetical protein